MNKFNYTMETTRQTPVQGAGYTPETFTVSRETAYFLTALKSFERAKDDYLTALTECYGEEQGGNLYIEHLADFDRVGQRITGGLLRSIEGNIGIDNNVI